MDSSSILSVDMEPADGEPAADEETRGSGEEQVQEPEEPPPTQTPSSDEPLPAVTVADPPNVLFKVHCTYTYMRGHMCVCLSHTHSQ